MLWNVWIWTLVALEVWSRLRTQSFWAAQATLEKESWPCRATGPWSWHSSPIVHPKWPKERKRDTEERLSLHLDGSLLAASATTSKWRLRRWVSPLVDWGVVRQGIGRKQLASLRGTDLATPRAKVNHCRRKASSSPKRASLRTKSSRRRGQLAQLFDEHGLS